MADIQPTFAGEVQLRRWSESSTQGVQITFALADAADLERFRGLDGKRFMAALVLLGDDEQPVPPGEAKPREYLGDLCWRAVQWCRDPEFVRWVEKNTLAQPGDGDEDLAKRFICDTCGVKSRKDLDTNPIAGAKFNREIRAPFQKYLIARGVVR